ncbi:cytochrome P450 [Camillea tinctor]|nr:cytochrome P450 [Camillea tinctor]
MSIPAPLVVAIIACLLAVLRFSRVGRRPKGYPPGPPTLPFIGNLHQMPREKGHLQFQKWAEEYGPIYSLILGKKVMIVLSSDQIVRDLLDNRGAIYSSRPESYLGQTILSGGLRVLFMKNDETWRMIRKLGHRILNINVSRSYTPYQDLENKAMLLGFLESPGQFIDHIRQFTACLTTQIAFGFRMTSDDPRFKKTYDMFDEFSRMIGAQTSTLLDVYPILRSLPDVFLPIRRRGREYHKMEHAFFLEQYLETKRKLIEGTAKPCFCVDLLRLQKEEGYSDDIASYISGSLLQAGIEQTAAALIGFVQAMVIFPEVAKTAQAELDRVCGDRIPEFDDNLPYIRGCVKETLRWMPPDILGLPHCAVRDDEYSGYQIPKDATVIFNVWAIQNDPLRHPNPREFDPSRWSHDNQTSAEAATNPDVTKRDHFVFGAGRRLCQGTHIVDHSLFLAMARLLWAFDFHRAVDPETQQEIIPDMEDLIGGAFVQPRPFKANIVPRSGKAKRVEEEWDTVRNLLDDDLQWKAVPRDLVWGGEYKEEGSARSSPVAVI